jgi:transposase
MNTTSSLRDWKEARRFRAFDLKQAGWSQQEIAEALGVTKGAVSQWMSAVKADGVDALFARPHPGGPTRLTIAQRTLLPDLLTPGAEAYGFRGNVWTCARVAKVIEWEWGVVYHPAHVSRILKELNWTPQKPIERASQRNETLIEHWRTEVWPELKKSPPGATNPGLY